MILTGVCISQYPETWKLPYALVTNTDGWMPYDQMSDFDQRIGYLARRRNDAVDKALDKYPGTTDIMMVDSYFVHQTNALAILVGDYRALDRKAILGATVWGEISVRLRDYLMGSKTDFYDKLSVPDARFVRYGWKPQKDFLAQWFRVPVKGFYHVCSVGGCYIFPRSLWDQGNRYAIMEDGAGCEHNYFCLHSGLPIFLDFNSELWRSKRYSLGKRIRVTGGAILRRYRDRHGHN